MINRRHILQTAAGAGLVTGLNSLLPAWAQSYSSGTIRHAGQSRAFDLNIALTPLEIGQKKAMPTTVNGTVPAPLLRFQEGDKAVLRVTNTLQEDTSIHWHGILLPYQMDGVPGLSFPGIRPGETFEYEFDLKQNGTYWYHSHSGFQEQLGLYGPLIIDPEGPEPESFDRDYVIFLSDWTFENPRRILSKLKKQADYYNFRQKTVGDFFRNASDKGISEALSERMSWGAMRMAATDIADITGHTYTYLMNGQVAADNWTGLFEPGQRLRLRFINGSAMTYFNIRIPGLKMTVVQADGQNIRPVPVDEFQIAIAETFDVMVEPEADKAYTIMAESMDRSGYVRGTLAPQTGGTADVPPLREPPVRTMADMGMDHGNMDHGNMGHENMNHGNMNHATMGHTMPAPPAPTGHGKDHKMGPGVDMIAESPRNRLAEPGTGLANVGHRVLVYSDLASRIPVPDQRPPTRTIELHLTGNMERYMWSFDGEKFSHSTEPIEFRLGEKLRLVFVNDTMMEHPIHLHGLWMELENGMGKDRPRKHTVSVKPAERLSVLVTADAPGLWAFHCHLLFHMEAGMFRVVKVVKSGADA